MKLIWSWDAWQDYVGFWHEPNNQGGREKIDAMIEELKRNPRSRAYKAEALKYDLKSWSSMRITREHRFVYRASSDSLEILSCRYHYDG